MPISKQQVQQFRDAGFLVLEGFADASECDQLRARAETLVQEFDPAEVVSIFLHANRIESPTNTS
jgi:hypothetical protein